MYNSTHAPLSCQSLPNIMQETVLCSIIRWWLSEQLLSGLACAVRGQDTPFRDICLYLQANILFLYRDYVIASHKQCERPVNDNSEICTSFSSISWMQLNNFIGHMPQKGYKISLMVTNQHFFEEYMQDGGTSAFSTGKVYNVCISGFP